ncbi:hypothetical protein P3T29_006385, partial [Kitasatospora sp. MAP5-34]|nr:hypothetical protein [Kitasatospora sp. MAP5-34]
HHQRTTRPPARQHASTPGPQSATPHSTTTQDHPDPPAHPAPTADPDHHTQTHTGPRTATDPDTHQPGTPRPRPSTWGPPGPRPGNDPRTRPCGHGPAAPAPHRPAPTTRQTTAATPGVQAGPAHHRSPRPSTPHHQGRRTTRTDTTTRQITGSPPPGNHPAHPHRTATTHPPTHGGRKDQPPVTSEQPGNALRGLGPYGHARAPPAGTDTPASDRAGPSRPVGRRPEPPVTGQPGRTPRHPDGAAPPQAIRCLSQMIWSGPPVVADDPVHPRRRRRGGRLRP